MADMNYKNAVYNGLLMTGGILGSTFVVKKVKKDMAPALTTNSAVALGVVTVLSRVAIDYAKHKNWIAKEM